MNRKLFLKNTGILAALGLNFPLMAKHFTEFPGPVFPGKSRIVKNGEGKSIEVLGDKMTIKLSGEDTNNLFTLIEQNNEPGIGIPMHIHTREDEIFKVIEGELELTVDKETTVLKPGDIGYCPRNIPHSWRVTGTQNAKIDLSFYPAGMEAMFEELAELPPGPPDMKIVGEICARYGLSFL